MTKLFSLIACLLAALTTMAAARVHAFYWDSSTGMIDLGSLGGDSYATGINDSGQIVGYSFLADQSTLHLVMWATTGGIVDLGSLDDMGYSTGSAINSAGDIAGEGIAANGQQVAFFWSSSTGYVPLRELPRGGNSAAFGINNSDNIAGSAAGLQTQGFIWRTLPSRTQYIGTLPGGATSLARSINNSNHITGAADIPGGTLDAVVWTRDGGLRDIGTVVAGSSSYGFAINDRDEVVGFTNNTETPFYWSNATGIQHLRSLGGQNTELYGINNSGAIAGSSQLPANFFHATLWSSHRATPQDLGTLPGGTTSVAQGINNSGQIVGWSDLP